MWFLCSKCNKYKALWAFYKASDRPFSIRLTCIACIKKYNNKTYIDNKSYYINKAAKWRKENPEINRQYQKKYRDNNKSYYLQKKIAQQAKKRNQTPELTNIEKKKISLYYKISAYLGSDWHVDHIMPLSKGGLHHPDNLQIIPAQENLKKSNKENYTISKDMIIRI